QMGATNVIALGMSLLGGVFVPQSIMSKSVLAVAKFLPSYWYVLANNGISELSATFGDYLRPVFGSMLVQLGFALAIFAVTLLMSKEQKVS
ncbi:MAG: ABC transporter permease, partial [Bacillota bacterium]